MVELIVCALVVFAAFALTLHSALIATETKTADGRIMVKECSIAAALSIFACLVLSTGAADVMSDYQHHIAKDKTTICKLKGGHIYKGDCVKGHLEVVK